MAKERKQVERSKWLPPDDWYRTQPRNRSVRDCIAEYYKVYPEHRPPPEYFELLRQLPLKPLTDVEYRLSEARLGDPGLLISQLQTGAELDPLECDYLVEVLERDAGKPYDDRLREIEWFLIAFQVDRRVREGGKQESVIRDVMQRRNCSRATVFKALAAYRSKYG